MQPFKHLLAQAILTIIVVAVALTFIGEVAFILIDGYRKFGAWWLSGPLLTVTLICAFWWSLREMDKR